jgi:protein SCO1/2
MGATTTLDRRDAAAGAEGSGVALAGFFSWLAVTAAWWALAFARLPEPPVWLERTREVCFGTLPNGLPEPWGWALLVLGPASMLVFLLAIWRRELAVGLALLARSPLGWCLLAPAAALALGGAATVGARLVEANGGSAVLAGEAGPLPETYPRYDRAAPPLPTVDQHGAPFDLAQLRGRPVLLTFVFGHCPVVCPNLTSTLKRASFAYPGTPPPVVVVTLDPWRDTPAALPGLLAKWGIAELPGVRMLSGPVPEVMASVEQWEVGFTRDESTGDIGHAGMIFVLDGEGRVAYRFLGPPARWLVEAALRLEQEAV